MAFRFGTEQWAAALRDEINGSSEYRNSATTWGVGFNGDMLFRFEADEGLSESLRLVIRLGRGTCAETRFVEPGALIEAGFTLSAPFNLWREILERRTLAATAILTGRLKVGGEKMTLLKHTAANRALIHCAASVDTLWD